MSLPRMGILWEQATATGNTLFSYMQLLTGITGTLKTFKAIFLVFKNVFIFIRHCMSIYVQSRSEEEQTRFKISGLGIILSSGYLSGEPEDGQSRTTSPVGLAWGSQLRFGWG